MYTTGRVVGRTGPASYYLDATKALDRLDQAIADAREAAQAHGAHVDSDEAGYIASIADHLRESAAELRSAVVTAEDDRMVTR